MTFNILLDTQKKISWFSLPPLPHSPPQINISSFSLNPTDELEVKNIVLSLNPSKTLGPNSIPTKTLKLLISDVSSRLSERFNFSFSRRVFPLILKTSKVISVYKKD